MHFAPLFVFQCSPYCVVLSFRYSADALASEELGHLLTLLERACPLDVDLDRSLLRQVFLFTTREHIPELKLGRLPGVAFTNTNHEVSYRTERDLCPAHKEDIGLPNSSTRLDFKVIAVAIVALRTRVVSSSFVVFSDLLLAPHIHNGELLFIRWKYVLLGRKFGDFSSHLDILGRPQSTRSKLKKHFLSLFSASSSSIATDCIFSTRLKIFNTGMTNCRTMSMKFRVW